MEIIWIKIIFSQYLAWRGNNLFSNVCRNNVFSISRLSKKSPLGLAPLEVVPFHVATLPAPRLVHHHGHRERGGEDVQVGHLREKIILVSFYRSHCQEGLILRWPYCCERTTQMLPRSSQESIDHSSFQAFSWTITGHYDVAESDYIKMKMMNSWSGFRQFCLIWALPPPPTEDGQTGRRVKKSLR